MPSPTSRTRPTSWAWTPVCVSLISLSITETISPTLNGMAAPLDQVVADGLDAGAYAGVVDPVPDAHNHPAQQGRVDRLVEDRLAPGDLLQVAVQPAALVVGQG